MEKQRLEAFSDGVIAIIITIMALELKPPHEASFSALLQVAPVFFSYVLSFAYIAIYWNNHHHLLQAATHVTGGVLWANIHLLFWLSLIPFASAWMSENHFAQATVAIYGVSLLAPAIAYFILSRMLLKTHGPESTLTRAIGADVKGKLSVLLYLLAIGLTLVDPRFSLAIYVFVALMWLAPDPRIERVLAGQRRKESRD
ncbi:TMEM175 family protein [Methylocystis sp.]|uniref:TMEM175 family protein n=1 Tax=Methylocystis sp. TaxID=1911079 RepID=UPI003D0B679A